MLSLICLINDVVITVNSCFALLKMFSAVVAVAKFLKFYETEISVDCVVMDGRCT